MKHFLYTVYIVIYETLVLGGCGYAVFVLNHSGWWFLLATLFSAGAYPPERFIFGKVNYYN